MNNTVIKIILIPLMHYLKWNEYMNEMLQSYYMHMEQLEVFEAIAERFLSLKRLRLCTKCRGLFYEGYVSTHIKYFA